MKIEEIKQYKIGDRIFDSKEEALDYASNSEESKNIYSKLIKESNKIIPNFIKFLYTVENISELSFNQFYDRFYICFHFPVKVGKSKNVMSAEIEIDMHRFEPRIHLYKFIMPTNNPILEYLELDCSKEHLYDIVEFSKIDFAFSENNYVKISNYINEIFLIFEKAFQSTMISEKLTLIRSNIRTLILENIKKGKCLK